jgi:O-Antigen ligase
VFTAQPLVSLGIALLRSLFLLGLLVTGWQLHAGGVGRARSLLALLPGLVVVLLSALVYSLHRYGLDGLLHARLQHPSYQMVSLGLAASLTLWLAVCWPGRSAPGGQSSGGQSWRSPWLIWPVRVFSAVLALGVLVLGQSRAPLAAALLGLLAAGLYALVRSRLSWQARGAWLLSAAFLVGGSVYVAGRSLGTSTLNTSTLSSTGSHLTQLSLNGRDTYWEEAAGVFRAFPLGGSGVGQLGNAARSNQDNCFQGGPTFSVGCPAWELQLSARPWFAPARKLSWMAHNVSLQNLAETGLIGSAGYFLMLGLVVAAAFASRRPLLIALATGYSVVNLVDNSTMLPSLAVSEVFWLAGGVALREVNRLSLWSGRALKPLGLASLWGGALLLLSLVPVVMPSLLPARGPVPTVLALNAARQGAALGQTTLHLGLGQLGGGAKRLRLELCTPICGVERVQDIVPDAGGEWWGALALPQLKRGQVVRVQVLAPESGLLSTRPLGELVWRQP